MTNNILALDGLRKNFGGVVAVADLSLTIAKGAISSLIGPNGAGKTTIFNLVTGFARLTGGDMIFSGRRINGMKPHAIAGIGISRTFQNVQIFPTMSVLENIMVGRHLRSRTGMVSACLVPPVLRKEEKRIREDAEKQLHFLGLAQYADAPAGSLPLGSQRMLEIARALALEPGLLLLDEPASGLNARETIVMGDLIGKIKAMNITVWLVEHDMDLVMDISDHVAVINFGSLIAQGTPAEIQRNEAVIAAYLGG
jgi:branched-chain amino acid transport system ATP-binding protein